MNSVGEKACWMQTVGKVWTRFALMRLHPYCLNYKVNNEKSLY